MSTAQFLPSLQNLNLRQNVQRKHVSNENFTADLCLVISACHKLQHLDLSGMNLTLKQITNILTKAVYTNKCIACAHIGYQGGELPQPIIEEQIPAEPELDQASAFEPP